MSVKKIAFAAASALALTALVGAPALASSRGLTPRAGEIKRPAVREAPYRAPPKVGGTWTVIANHFPGVSPDTPLQLTDGRIMVHDQCSQDVYAYSPDADGDYANGTWSKLGSLPKGYAPLYFASQVLADGRVVMNGGEYNGTSCDAVWTNKGAIYDPLTDKWKSVAVPKDVHNIGDAQSSVLPDGGYMLANALTNQQIVGTFDADGAPTWTSTGAGKKDRNDEEGWTHTPNHTIFTVDATRNATADVNKTEIYDIASGTWSDGEDTPNILVDPEGSEVGPALLIPDGRIFQVGGRPCGSESKCQGHTAVYDTLTGHWTAGPDVPKVGKGFGDSSDGPSALLPNGNVLIQTSPKFEAPSHFWEWNGSKLIRVSEPDQAPDMSSFEGRMMILPTGQIFWVSDQGDIEIYTTIYKTDADWAPVVGSAPRKLVRGHAGYEVSGIRFNGLTEGAAYGDDAQSYTNYPLVRITSKATGHVCYARTHDHSVMGVNGAEDPTSTRFDVPDSCEAGAGKLQVIANGMASRPVKVIVK
jgi:hypothetical protein